MNEFYEKMAEILEVDEVKPNDEIASFDNWDSLGVLAILAFADSRYDVTVAGEEIARMKLVSELEELIQRRANK